MLCMECKCKRDQVIDSRTNFQGTYIRRRRECLKCEHRWTTYERLKDALDETQSMIKVQITGAYDELGTLLKRLEP